MDTNEKQDLSEVKSNETDLEEPIILEQKKDTNVPKPIPVLRADKPKKTLSEKQLERNRNAAKSRVRKQMEDKIRRQIEEEQQKNNGSFLTLSPQMLVVGSVILCGGLFLTREMWLSADMKNKLKQSNNQLEAKSYQSQQNSLEMNGNDLLTVDSGEDNAFSW